MSVVSPRGRGFWRARRVVAALAVLAAALPTMLVTSEHSAFAAGAGCSTVATDLLVNPGFEQPVIPAATYRILPDASVPGWSTTAPDQQIEVWSTGFNGVPSYSGKQFAELNANQVSTLYQDIPTTPGSTITYAVAHRGRQGTDVFDIRMGAPAGPFTSMSGGAGYADGNTAWGVYSKTYVIPAGQTTTRFSFVSISSVGGASIGNFLDIPSFGVVAIQACPDTNATYAGVPVSGAAFANDTSVDSKTLVSYTQPANGTVVMNANGTYTYTPRAGFTGTDTYDYTIRDVAGHTATTSVTITVTNAPLPVLTTTKSVAVIGAPSAVEGATLRYTVTTTNTGNDNATGTVLTDQIPAGTTYVPGSLVVVSASSTPTGAMTDATGDDRGYSITGSNVGVNVGTGATATAGGTLAVGGTITVRFDVKINSGVAPSSVTNAAATTYTAPAIGTQFTTNSNTVTTPISTLSDLSVTKTANLASATAGQNLTYTVTVTNAGPSAAAATTVTDTLPSGTTLVSATPSTGSCTSGSTSCAIGSLASGASATVTYVVSTAPTLASGSLLSNTASVATSTPQSNTANDSVTISTPVVTLADVSVTKTASPSPIVPGANVTWTITASNAGPSVARSVTTNDTLPSGTTLVSVTPSTGSCTSGSVTCSLGDLAVGASATVTVVAKVDAATTASLANTAAVSSSTSDPTSGNNTATVTTTVTPKADLVVAKTADASSFVAGKPANWTYTVTNNGPSDAAAVTSSDTAPTAVSWTSASASTGSCSTTTAVVSCSFGTLPAGATVTVHVVGAIATNAAVSATSITNSASAATTTTDPNVANNTGSVTTPLAAQVQLESTKVATPDPAVAGSALTYTVTVKNLGPSVATGVTVTDPVPTGTSFTTTAPSSTIGTCSTAASALRCSVGTLAVGATATITVPVTVASGYGGTALVNTATVASNQTADQTPTWTSTVTQQADLQVVKSGPGPVVAGQNAVWSFSVTNAGPSDSSGAFLNDTFPSGTTFVSSSAPACTGTVGGPSVSCTWATLAAGATRSFTVTALVGGATNAGPLANSATVGASTPGDPTPSNNTSTAVATVSRLTNVTITKSGPATVAAGGAASYTIVAHNAGPSTATATVVTDTLPGGLTFDPATSDSRCSASGALVTCPLGTLTGVVDDTVTIGAAVSPSLTNGSTVTNSASVSTSTPETTTADNTATSSATVVAKADMKVTKTGPTSVTAGRPATWSVTLANQGPADAAGATLTDAPPTGVTWTSVVSSSALLNCTVSTGVCATGAGVVVPVGTTITVTYTGLVGSGVVEPSISNTASVTSPTIDPDTSNNSAAVTSPVVVQADIVVTKQATEVHPVAGLPTNWTITVTNKGPSVAAATALADTLPSGVTVTAMSSSSGSCSISSASCALGDIAVGATLTVGVTGLVSASLVDGSSLTNSATASSPTADPVPGDNTTSVTTTTTTQADLFVTKAAVGPSVAAGSTLTWAVTVGNNGPSNALSSTLTDPLPVGIVASSVTAAPSQGSCTVTGGAIACDVGTVAVGNSVTVTVTGRVASSTASGAVLTNVANASSASSDPVLSNNTASASIGITALANVTVTKRYTGAALTAGSPTTGTWQIVVANPGPSDAAAVQVTDTLPSTVTATALMTSQGTCTLGTASCALGTVVAGTSVTIDLAGTVSATHTGNLVNTAAATTTTPESSTSDNSSSTTTPVKVSADVSVTKTADGPIVAGSPASWTVTVHNAGPSVAAAVAVTDAAPNGVTWTSVTPSVGTCTIGNGSCALGSLASGATVTIGYVGTVAAGQVVDVTNDASVTSSTADPDLSNNSASVTGATVTSADIVVTKALDAPVTAGQAASWTVTVRNAGPSVSRSVNLADPAPAGVTWTSLSSSAGLCTTATGSCALGDLTVGQTVTVSYHGNVDATVSGSLANTATASATTPDPDTSSNSATATATVVSSADVVVIKSLDAPLLAGRPGSWTVTVKNLGPSVARSVVLADAAPAGVTWTSVGATSGSCTTGSGTCSLGDLAVGATVTVHLTGTIDSAATGSITNVAHATSSTSDPDPTEPDASVTATVGTSADIVTSKVLNAPVVAGQPASWTVIVKNLGPSVARSVTLADPTPSGVTWTSVSPTIGTCGATSGSCTFGDLAVGQSVTVTYTGAVSASTTGAIANTATASSSTTDPTPGNNASTASATANASADLVVTKSLTTALVAGRTAGWTVTVRNAGPSLARTVTLTDPAPSSVTWTAVAPSVGTCSLSASCSLGDLAVGAIATVSFTGSVDASATADVVNTATATSGTPDPDATNSAATTTHAVTTSADLTVTKVASGPLVAGRPASWTVTVRNLGPSTARAVQLSDPHPAGLTWTSVAPESGSCVTATGACSLGDVAVGATIAIVYMGAVDPAVTGTIANTATVSSTTPDPDLLSNSASTSTIVRTSADVVVAKTLTSTIVAGQSASWTVTVTNLGPSVATAVTLADAAPAGVSWTAVTPTLGSCTTVALCTFGDLTVGQAVTIAFVGQVASTTTGTIVNTATAASPTPDPDASSTTDSTTTTVITSADISVTKALDAPLVAGRPASWTVTVRNDGPSVARQVALADVAPAGVTWTAVSPTAGTCTTASGACTLGDLAPGDTVTIAYAGTLAADQQTDVSNVATVSTSTADPDSSNDVATVTGPVGTVADLAVIKSASGPFTAGKSASWSVRITNIGPSVARGVALADPVPIGVTWTAVSSSSGTCSVTSGGCTLGDLAVGQSVIVTYAGGIDPAFSGSLINTASVSSTTTDPDSSNSSSSTTTPVGTSADLVVTKQLDAPIVAGAEAQWTVSVRNAGPSVAVASALDDLAPSGVTWTSVSASAGTCTAVARCMFGDLGVGATVTVHLAGAVDAATTGTITNVAHATSSTADPDPTEPAATVTNPVGASADLVVTKQLDAPVVAGQPASWTVTVTNLGPSVARSVAVADPAPTDVTWTTVAASAGTCTAASGACALGGLAVGSTVTIHYTGSVDASHVGVVANHVSATSDTTDPNATNNTADTAGTANITADLVVTKTATTALVAGRPASWTVTVRNVGPSLARAVTLSDPAPSGVTWTSAVPSSGTCTRSVSCPLGDLAVGAMVTIVVTGDINSAYTGTLANTASATSTTPDPTPSNSSATASGPVATTADLSVTKVVDAPLIAGRPASWTVTVTNLGPSVSRGVTVGDAPPAGISWTAISPSVGSCAIGTGRCTLGDLAVGQTTTIAYVGAVDASVIGTVTNTATVAATTTDPDPSNDAATTSSDASTSADVVVTKTLTTALAAGRSASWTVTVENVGPSVASAVTLTDPEPSGVTWTAVTPTSGSCSSTGSCSFGELAVGARVTVVYDALVDPAAVGTVVNTASATAATPDPLATNNTATTSTVVAVAADLSVTKSLDAPVVAGTAASWTVTITNHGPALARGVTVADPAPAGVTWMAVVSTAGSCSAASGDCTLGSLAPGAVVTIHYTGTVVPGQTIDVTNAASVSSATPDPDGSDNAATVTGPVVASADLAVTKTAAGPLTAGQPASWTVTVTNRGPSVARAATVADPAPSGVTWTAFTPTSGVCAVVTASCTFGDLAVGQTVSVTVQGIIDAALAGPVVNTAAATSLTTDPDGSNSSATTSTPVAASADLTVVKTLDAPIISGTPARWTIAVHNAGPSIARAVTVTDVAPAGVAWSSVNSSTGSCSLSVSCTLGDLGVGSTVTVHVTGAVDPASTGSITNVAHVSSPTPDPDPSESSGTLVSPVSTLADLVVAKALDAPIIAGSPASWTVTVTNHGPSVARAVTLSDPAPAGVVWTAAGGSVGSCTLATGACTIGDLAVGATVTVAFAGNVDPAQTAPVVNTVTVASPTTDPDPSTNSATNPGTVAVAADLVVTKSVDGPIVAGRPASWTVTVENRGPSSARAVVIDPAPVGVSWTAISASTGSCSLITGTCSFGDLAFGQLVTVHYTGLVDPGVNGSVVNTAMVDATTPDPDPSSNLATTATAATSSADLVVTKMLTSTITAGTPASWKVTVTNQGPSVARAVSLADPAPTGVRWTSVLTGSGSCNVASGGCSFGDLAPGASVTIVYRGVVDPTVTGTVANTASASSATTDPDPSTNVATVVSAVGTAADVTVIKTLTSALTAGRSATWTVTVTNANGPSVARNVLLSDPPPVGVTWTAVSATTGTCTIATGHCVLGDLAVGRTVTITYTGLVDSSATGSVTNTATADGPTPDPTPASNTATTVDPIATLADVSVTKALDVPIVAGTAATWTVTVVNHGPSSARSVTVTDAPPPGITWTTITPSAGTCSLATGACDLGDMTNDATVSIVFTGNVDPARTGTVANTAAVSSTTPDPDSSDNRVVLNRPMGANADLLVTKLGASTPVVAGTATTWQITVTNLGPSTAVQATLTDPAPAGITFTSVSTSTSSAACSMSTGALQCSFGDLPVGAVVVVSVGGNLDPSIGVGQVVNTATALSATPDPDAANSIGTATITSTTLANLSTSKSGPATVTPGTDATWTVVVTNRGPSDAGAVTIHDLLPFGVSLVSLMANKPTVTCDGTTVSCLAPSIAPGATVAVTVVGHLASAFPGVALTNVATAVSALTVDPDAANNAGTTTASVAPQAQLALRIVVDHAAVTTGDRVAFTVSLANGGPSTAGAVHVVVQVPAGLTVDTGSLPTGAVLAADGRSITWDPGDVVPGATPTFTYAAVASAPGTTAVPTTTMASASSASAAAGSALTATTGVVVHPLAKLMVTKVADRATAVVGDPIVWTITVTNLGPSAAGDVIVVERMPTTLRFEGATPTAGTWDSASMSWSLGTMAVGASQQLAVHTIASEPGPVSNMAEGRSTTPSTAVLGGAPPVAAVASATADAVVLPRTKLPTTGINALALTEVASLLVVMGVGAVGAGRRRQRLHAERVKLH